MLGRSAAAPLFDEPGKVSIESMLTNRLSLSLFAAKPVWISYPMITHAAFAMSSTTRENDRNSVTGSQTVLMNI